MSAFTLTAIIAGAVLAVIGGGVYWWTRPVPEEPIYHFKCPHCQRRLRYRPRQMGKSGTCPLCRKTFTFPTEAHD